LITSISSTVVSKFEKVALNINADVQIAVKNSTTQNWTITDVYNPASNMEGA
jgi:hypothetical protein